MSTVARDEIVTPKPRSSTIKFGVTILRTTVVNTVIKPSFLFSQTIFSATECEMCPADIVENSVQKTQTIEREPLGSIVHLGIQQIFRTDQMRESWSFYSPFHCEFRSFVLCLI